MPNLVQDLRYGFRTLTRAPGFTAMSAAVLALGIGVNATVFSLANAVFLRPLPVANPGEIVRVYANRYSNVAYRTYLELRERNSTLGGLAAFQGQAFGLRIDGDVEHPRSIDCALRKLRMNSPATISSSTDIDTWLTRGAGAFGRLFRGGGASRRNRRDLG